MNTSPHTETPSGRPLRTSDLASAGSRPVQTEVAEDTSPSGEDGPLQASVSNAADGKGLEPLFTPDRAADFRARWTAVQSGFVDDPRSAVQQGDELVAHVMKSLAETFADERDDLERQLSETSEASTENLRVTLRRYRSFFERLLTL